MAQVEVLLLWRPHDISSLEASAVTPSDIITMSQREHKMVTQHTHILGALIGGEGHTTKNVHCTVHMLGQEKKRASHNY